VRVRVRIAPRLTLTLKNEKLPVFIDDIKMLKCLCLLKNGIDIQD
jgi:hypothetical protein